MREEKQFIAEIIRPGDGGALRKSSNTLSRTNFNFPGQTAVYHGKVRDVYTIDNKYVILVATDRISAFDSVLKQTIPYKGAVLNMLSIYFLEAADKAIGFDNWYSEAPDDNALLGKKADPIKIEMVVRNNLVGHAWREYKSGKREICGIKMPEGMREYDPFPEPIITPTTKKDDGHDEAISKEEILSQQLVNQDEWVELEQKTRKLFNLGQEMAKAKNLLLADTKYEFGRLDGHIILIDEVHTPDSSRYFYLDSFNKYLNGQTTANPKHLSKEFVREWLIKHGFSGEEGQKIPNLTDEFIDMVSKRYIELYETITGETFNPASTDNIEHRIYENVKKRLKELGYE